MKDPEYYCCYVGPIDRAEFDKSYHHGEDIIRSSIIDAFHHVAGHWPETCSSGWGVKPDSVSHIGFATHTEETKKQLVDSYFHGNIKFPRYIMAWFLLLQSEGVYPKEQQPITESNLTISKEAGTFLIM